MSANGKDDQIRIGFLTAIGDPQRGHVAGLLVTNRFGRPLEFQCTTVVKANRTQEILYGPTLVPFILGELISRTLIEKVGVKPHLIVTDRDEILEVRNHVSIPVISFAALPMATPPAAAPADSTRQSATEVGNATSEPSTGLARTTAEQSSPHTADALRPADKLNAADANLSVAMGRQLFHVHPNHPRDCQAVQKMAVDIASETDFGEPLERVREALSETMGKAAGAAA